MSMKPIFLLGVLWSMVLAAAAADQDTQSVFQIRKVLNGPTADSEQMVLIHQAQGNAQQIKEVLNVTRTPVLEDSAVKAATVGVDETTGKPQIEVTFTEQGRKQFAEMTKANLNRRLAILVNGKVLIAPVIRTEIAGGQAIITGNFSNAEAQQLADAINSAARSRDRTKQNLWTHGPYDAR
jgi:preprotein translocase subunit SecD